jgi:hypothetical protein
MKALPQSRRRMAFQIIFAGTIIYSYILKTIDLFFSVYTKLTSYRS